MNLIEYTRMYEVEERHWWYVGLHNLVLTIVQQESQRLARPLKIFDAGCGTGRLCQLLKEQRHSVSGCDYSEEALRLCRLRGVNDTFHADLNAIGLEAESFDLITSIDVLYHRDISDDVAVMQRLRTALRPGGMLILNLVACEFLRSTHDIAVHTRERYSKSLLCKRLRDAGLNIEFVTYRVCFLFPFIAPYRLLSRWTACREADPGQIASDIPMPHRLLNALFWQCIELENRILGMTGLPFGSSLFAVARN